MSDFEQQKMGIDPWKLVEMDEKDRIETVKKFRDQEAKDNEPEPIDITKVKENLCPEKLRSEMMALVDKLKIRIMVEN